jgi:hypothetical protein
VFFAKFLCVLSENFPQNDICPMQNTVSLSDILSEMRKLDEAKNPIPFSISVRSFDAKKLSGGKLKVYENAVLLQAPKTKGVKRLSDQTPFKNPNHFANRTRNIKDVNGIHIKFIIRS